MRIRHICFTWGTSDWRPLVILWPGGWPGDSQYLWCGRTYSWVNAGLSRKMESFSKEKDLLWFLSLRGTGSSSEINVCSSGGGELVLKGSLFKAETEENQADHTNSSGLTQKCEVLWNGKCVLIMSLILTAVTPTLHKILETNNCYLKSRNSSS